MGVVMVPVPEEHVEEFNRFILGLSLLGAEVKAEACVAARDALDEPHRRLLDAVCRAAAFNRRIPYSEAAEEVGSRVEELLQQTIEINHVFKSHGAPATVLTDSEVVVREDGTTGVQPVVFAVGSVASVLRSYQP